MTTAPGAAPSSDQWVSNASSSEIAKTLRGASNILIFTHMKPDGDAAGSTLALVRTLNLMPGKRAQACYAGPLAAWMPLVCGRTPVRTWEKDGPPSDEPDAIIVIDTGSWSQLEAFRSYLEPRAARTIVIDHHRRGDAAVGAKRWIDVGAAAVCQQAAGLCCMLLSVLPDQLPQDIAAACYLGLATDTGWFKHSNVTPDVMRLAADLLESGVDANAMYQMIDQQDTLGRLRLMSRALASLELHEEGRVAVMALAGSDFQAAGAHSTDSGGLIDLPLTIATVKVAAIVTEADPSEYGKGSGVKLTKVSMRSKTDAIDVDQVCRTLGGGGHKRAAGAKISIDLASAKAQVIQALSKAVSALA
jgi:phosphoesterase RecJ-like protein